MKETHCVPKMVEVSLLEVGTVLRLEKGAWLMVEGPRQATTEYAPPPPPPGKPMPDKRTKVRMRGYRNVEVPITSPSLRVDASSG